MSSEENFFNERPQTSILRQIVNRYLPFWPVFVLLTAISLSITYIYLRSQTRIYVAASKVLLKDPTKSSSETKILEALNIYGEKKNVDNEIVVLKSSSLMQEVVKDLNLYALVYNKGNVQTEELYGSNSPIVFEAINKDSIRAAGKKEFSIDWDKKLVEIDGKLCSFWQCDQYGGNQLQAGNQ